MFYSGPCENAQWHQWVGCGDAFSFHSPVHNNVGSEPNTVAPCAIGHRTQHRKPAHDKSQGSWETTVRRTKQIKVRGGKNAKTRGRVPGKDFWFLLLLFCFFLQISKVSEFQGPREGLGIEIFSKYKVSRILEWKHIAKKSSYISWTRKYSSAVSLQQLLKPFIFPGCEGWSKQTCLLYLMGNKFIRLVPAAPLTTRLSSSDVTFGCEEALWKACQYKTGSASPLPLKH